MDLGCPGSRDYLAAERGLSPSTVATYAAEARSFLAFFEDMRADSAQDDQGASDDAAVRAAGRRREAWVRPRRPT